MPIYKINLAIITITIFTLSIFVIPTSVNAQDTKNLCAGANLSLDKVNSDCTKDTDNKTCEKDGKVVNCSEQSLNKLIAQIINIFSIIVGIIAVIMMIYGGFRYITSGGDTSAIETAKKTIIYAIIGLIIVALAQFVVKFILSKLN